MVLKPTLKQTILGVLVILVLLETGAIHFLRPLEYQFQDFLLRHHAATRLPDPGVVVVSIDERSLAKMAQEVGGWPWPRAVHADLIRGIEAEKPAAIVLDIQFTDPDRVRPDSDRYFTDTASKSAATFFPIALSGNNADGALLSQVGPVLGFDKLPGADPDARVNLLLPLEQLARTGRVGLINFLQDEDGIGRRYWVRMDIGGWRIPSLPAKVAAALGYPLPRSASMVLNWCGGTAGLPHLSYYDVYEDFQRQHRQRPADEFRDKIVVIGATATGLGDMRPTPLSSIYPGVDIVATAISNLKDQDYLRRAPALIGMLAGIVLILLLGAVMRLSRGVVIGGIGMVVLTPLTVGGAYLALSAGWLVPAMEPLSFGWLAYICLALADYVKERRERKRAVSMFGRFIDPRVVHELIQRGDVALRSEPRSSQITVLFSDIRGFTSLSETRSPEQIVSILNRYFSRQVAVIWRHGGTVDKFIGDCIMAFWGAPVADPQQAQHAVAAALEMSRVVDEFRRELDDTSAQFDIGIGIHTGPAVVGFMGAEGKLDYTAIGDTVNLGSRIESQTKGVARILVSALTREQCGAGFDFIERGTYKVKGREQPVQLFEPVKVDP
ncbi:MAG TPA: adenylate/guanylate cyclase domain-containing protein [Gammaproteobacteria bacterium]|nr:adenylate/guanylate cyclase domain-containing protein [Gammaproteobacteria bacterium]